MVKFTDGNFQEEVENADGVTVVDFWAEWCGPCRLIGPVLEQLSEEYNGQVKIGKLNVDDNAETAMKFGIRSIPTILFFKNGELLDKHVGTGAKQLFKRKIDALLN